MRKTILAVLTLLALPGALCAQTTTTQKYGFSPEAFEIKYYIQPRWAWYSEPYDLFDAKLAPGTDNTFSIRRSRFYVTSNVSPSIRGRIQFEVKPEKTEALDVFFEFNPKLNEKRPLTFKIGQYKKPMSYQEFVMESNNLNLIDRTFAHDFMEKKLYASSRDQGLMVIGDLWEYGWPVTIDIGVFNGNGKNVKYDSNAGKQFVGRVEVTPLTGVSVGVNGETNTRGYASDSTSTEQFSVWGADLVLAKSGFQVVSEVFGGENTESLPNEPAVIPEMPTFFAWYAEAIYRARSGWEPAVRYEIFDPDQDTDDDDRSILTGQIAYTFSPNFRWQVNVSRELFQNDAIKDLTAVVSQWTIRL